MEMHQLRYFVAVARTGTSVEPRANAVLPSPRSASRSKSWNLRLAIDSSSGPGAGRFSLPLGHSFCRMRWASLRQQSGDAKRSAR